MFPSWMRSRKLIPRPMYFLAIETTRRRLAAGQLLAGVTAHADQLAAALGELRVGRHRGVVAHLA